MICSSWCRRGRTSRCTERGCDCGHPRLRLRRTRLENGGTTIVLRCTQCRPINHLTRNGSICMAYMYSLRTTLSWLKTRSQYSFRLLCYLGSFIARRLTQPPSRPMPSFPNDDSVPAWTVKQKTSHLTTLPTIAAVPRVPLYLRHIPHMFQVTGPRAVQWRKRID